MKSPDPIDPIDPIDPFDPIDPMFNAITSSKFLPRLHHLSVIPGSIKDAGDGLNVQRICGDYIENGEFNL